MGIAVRIEIAHTDMRAVAIDHMAGHPIDLTKREVAGGEAQGGLIWIVVPRLARFCALVSIQDP